MKLRASSGRLPFRLGVIATLAIAIGANVAVLGDLGAMFGRVVPGARYQNILAPTFKTTAGNMPMQGTSRFVYKALAAHLKGRAVTGLYQRGQTATLGSRYGNRKLRTLRVNAAVARVFGIHPEAGRLLTQADSAKDASPVIVISDRLARRLFANAQAAVGHRLSLHTARGGAAVTRYRIVGILPQGFQFPVNNVANVWLPFRYISPYGARHTFSMSLQPLLRPTEAGLSHAALLTQLRTAYTDGLRSYGPGVQSFIKSLKPKPRVITLARQQFGSLYKRLGLVEIAALLLAFVVLVNLAGLAAADALARRRDQALRGVFGAKAGRLYRERFAEFALLALIGWAAGIGLGWIGRRALTAAFGQLGASATFSFPVLGATLGFALATAAVLAALGFVRRRAPASPLALLGTGARATGGRMFTLTLRTLIVLQLTASVVLLVIAAHLRTNVLDLTTHHLGFNPAGRVLVDVALPVRHVLHTRPRSRLRRELKAMRQRREHYVQRFLKRLAGTPGIVSAATLSGVVEWGNFTALNVSLHKPKKHGWDASSEASLQSMSRSIVKAAGLQVLAGSPNAAFGAGSHSVFIDTVLAKRLWPHATAKQALGRTFYLGGNAKRVAAVVSPLRIDPYSKPRGSVFAPYRSADRFVGANNTAAFILHVGFAAHLRKTISRIVRKIDPEAFVFRYGAATQAVDRAYAQRRHLGEVFGAVSVVAVLITGIGLFALLAYRSLVRRPEFAVRTAIGATPGRLLNAVLMEAVLLWAGGCIAGIPAAYAVSVVLATNMDRLGLPAAGTVVAVAVALGAAALAAAFLPARHAGRVNPATELQRT